MVRCIIPARKGSRRIEGKNLLRINGKSLIDTAVDSAAESGVCDQILLSTDIDVKRGREGVTLDRRPAKLSGSLSTSGELLFYLVQKYKMNKEDAVIFLQPTSPLRTSRDIRNAFRIFVRKKLPLVSVCRADRLNDNLMADNGQGVLRKIKIRHKEIYRLNGAIFIFTVKQFLSCGAVPQGRVAFYPMDEIYSSDVDEYSDFINAAILK